MNSGEIRAALRTRYSDHRRYAIAEEVGLSTGFSHRRLDMMVLDCYASNGFRIDGIEIKVSKADLKRELEDPEKHVAFFGVIDYYTLACPKGIADLSLLPQKWGVMIVNDDYSTRYLRRPIALHDEIMRDVPRGFLASITRAIQGREPSAEELEAEYLRGKREQREEHERQRKHTADRLDQEYGKLKAYDELQSRFSLWGDDKEKYLDQFEAFRNGNPDWMISSAKSAKANLERFLDEWGKLEVSK